MQLGKLQAVLRQRSSFEAIDLGFAMARRWWGATWGAWLICVAPVYAIVWALLHGSPIWAYVVLWWLIPIFDRVPLFVISRALFGEQVGLRGLLRELPRLWTRHLIYSLVLYRFDLARSFIMPMLQLEGGELRTRSRRRAALSRGMLGPSAWLTTVSFSLHVVMAAAFFVLLVLVPRS